MLRVGLTGGLASGKSFVGRTLADLGCLWIQADELGHRVIQPGGAAYNAVVAEFGRGILGKDGAPDRQRLAALVFESPERLARLNKLVHPPVLELEEKLMADFAAREPHGIAVVEAAILLETGSYRRFDRIVVTWCEEQQQIERAMKRAGATRQQVLARLRRQLPLSEKLKLADYVIDTSGAKQETVKQVQKLYDSLQSIVS